MAIVEPHIATVDMDASHLRRDQTKHNSAGRWITNTQKSFNSSATYVAGIGVDVATAEHHIATADNDASRLQREQTKHYSAGQGIVTDDGSRRKGTYILLIQWRGSHVDSHVVRGE